MPPNAQQNQPPQVEQLGIVNYVDHYVESVHNPADIVLGGFVLLAENNHNFDMVMLWVLFVDSLHICAAIQKWKDLRS